MFNKTGKCVWKDEKLENITIELETKKWHFGLKLR